VRSCRPEDLYFSPAVWQLLLTQNVSHAASGIGDVAVVGICGIAGVQNPFAVLGIYGAAGGRYNNKINLKKDPCKV